MQEEASASSGSYFTQVATHQHQVIIVGPNKIFGSGGFGSGLGEAPVYALINLPELGIEVAA